MPGTGNKLTAECCAKTNLYLHVVGKRPDSFHEIETLFYPVTKVKDILTIDFAPGKGSSPITIFCDSPQVPTDASNLCWKAAELYFREARLSPVDLIIYLEKGIPVSGGMGGGSSDCAAVLLLMEEYFGALGKEALYSLAAKLGSDVAFFLDPVPSIGRGRGEKLERLSAEKQKLSLLFVSPHFPISAAWAYTHLDYSRCREKNPPLTSCREALEKGDLSLLQENLRNDLAPALFRKFPILPILQEALEAEGGAKALLSGSGPTLFALFEEEGDLQKRKEKLQQKFAGEKLSFF